MSDTQTLRDMIDEAIKVKTDQHPSDRVISIAREALQWASEMFRARDEMNAKVHCSPVRLSPITERIDGAINTIDQYNTKW